MLLKKLVVAALSVLMLAQPMMFVGCSEQPTEPTENQSQVQDPAIAEAERQSKLFESMIAKMDPYVTTNSDGTYSIDYQAFQSANQLTGDEMKVADELNKGITIINAQVIQERKEPQSTALGSACWNYWWGQRCCFWGNDAIWYAAAISAGSAIPVFGWGFSILGPLAGALTAQYGGFCLNKTWPWMPAAIWLTKP